MRLPTFSRQSEPDTAEVARPAAAGTTTTTETRPVRPRRETDTTVTDLPPVGKPASKPAGPPPPPPGVKPAEVENQRPVPVGPKPRASLLATLSLILGVAGALLVLSGPLVGYGIGVSGLALVLSLAGIHATGKRHVAGKTDALIGMVLSLGAIVLGVLALTGSLSWLGTDVQPVSNLREWLDTQFADRF